MTTYLVEVIGTDYDSEDKVNLSFFVEAGSPEIAESTISQNIRVNALETVSLIKAKAC